MGIGRTGLLAAAVWMAAGAALSAGQILTIGELYDGGVVNLTPNDQLVVRLSSDPATGEAWEVSFNDAAVLKPVGEPSADAPAGSPPEAPGPQVFRFRAIATGSSSLGLAYQKTANLASAPARLFRVLVVVKDRAPRRSLTLAEPDNGSTVFLTQGERIFVRLPSNRSTGYGWTVARNAPSVLQPVGDPRFETPEKAAPGASGYQIFEFRVVAEGASSLAMVYQRPSDKGSPPGRTWGIFLAAAGVATAS
jgi:inhibitor of cysteine peptidase